MAPSSASTTGPAKSGSSVALSSAPALILLQVISRLLAFALNQALVRLTSPAIFGAANIQLELLLSTILFLSREGVRGALLRRKSEQEDGAKVDNGAEAGDEASAARSAGRTATEQSLHNISFLPLPAGAVISLLATAFYMRRAPLAMQHQPYFRSSVALYAAGALLELCSEPLYIYAQREGRVQLRVRAEGAAILLKCITTLLGVRLCGDSRALLAFACGQAAYGLTTLTVYLFAYARSAGMGGLVGLLHPKRVPAAPARHSTLPARRYLFDPSTARLAGVMAAQSVLKHLLTEGDKLAAGRLGSLADQGGYALASNYGSLVARMLFQPVEESARLVFSQTLGSVASSTGDQIQTGESGDGKIKADSDSLRPVGTKSDHTPAPSQTSGGLSRPALVSSAQLLSALFKAHLLLGSFFLTFGPPLSRAALLILAGPRWASTSAPEVLSAYAFYLPVMGLNGLAEAFLQATAPSRELAAYSRMMLGASALFAAALWLLSSEQGLGMKESGLVWANILNLAARAAYSWRYTTKFFATHTSPHAIKARGAEKLKADAQGTLQPPPDVGLRAALPRLPTLCVFALVAGVLRWSEARGRTLVAPTLRELFGHIGVSVLCLTACLASCVIFERRAIIGIVSALRGGRRHAKQE